MPWNWLGWMKEIGDLCHFHHIGAPISDHAGDVAEIYAIERQSRCQQLVQLVTSLLTLNDCKLCQKPLWVVICIRKMEND